MDEQTITRVSGDEVIDVALECVECHGFRRGFDDNAAPLAQGVAAGMSGSGRVELVRAVLRSYRIHFTVDAQPVPDRSCEPRAGNGNGHSDAE